MNISDKIIKCLEPYKDVPNLLYELLGSIYDSLDGIVDNNMLPEIEVLDSYLEHIGDLTRATKGAAPKDACLVKIRDIYVPELACRKLLKDLANSVRVRYSKTCDRAFNMPMLSVVNGVRKEDYVTPCCKIYLFKDAFGDLSDFNPFTKLYSDICDIDIVLDSLVRYISDASYINAMEDARQSTLTNYEEVSLMSITNRLELNEKDEQVWISIPQLTTIKSLICKPNKMLKFFRSLDKLSVDAAALFINRCRSRYSFALEQISKSFKSKHVMTIFNILRKWWLQPRTGVYVDTYRDYDGVSTGDLLFIFDVSDELFIDNVIEAADVYETFWHCKPCPASKMANTATGYRATDLEQFKKDVEESCLENADKSNGGSNDE